MAAFIIAVFTFCTANLPVEPSSVNPALPVSEARIVTAVPCETIAAAKKACARRLLTGGEDWEFR